MTQVFVSYTKKDGLVTNELLHRIAANLSDVCDAYVHALALGEGRFEEVRVIRKLLGAQLLILLESPAVYDSRWVRFELALARLKMMPIVKVRAVALAARLGAA